MCSSRLCWHKDRLPTTTAALPPPTCLCLIVHAYSSSIEHIDITTALHFCMDTCNYRFHFERDEGKNEEQNQKATQVACVCVRASVSVHSPFCVLLLSIFCAHSGRISVLFWREATSGCDSSRHQPAIYSKQQHFQFSLLHHTLKLM